MELNKTICSIVVNTHTMEISFDEKFAAIILDPAFVHAWVRFINHRIEKKKPMNHRTMTKWLRWIKEKEFTVQEAVSIIEKSILHDWIGLFDPNEKKQHGKAPGQGTSADRIDALKKW